MKVRDAGPSDNAALVDLAALCPMNGRPVAVRRPAARTSSRSTGSPAIAWRVGVVDGDDGPIACIAVARREVYLNGEPARLGLRRRPEGASGAPRRRAPPAPCWAGRSTTARDLIGADGPLLGTVLAGNTAVDTPARTASHPGVRRWATIRSHSISLLWRRRLPPHPLTVRAADAGRRSRHGRAVAAAWPRPPVRPGLHHAVHSPGLDYLVAHHPGGELAGFLGLWDQHDIKQMRVTGYSPRLAAARALSTLPRLFSGYARMPAPGGELSYRTVVSPCAPDPADAAHPAPARLPPAARPATRS